MLACFSTFFLTSSRAELSEVETEVGLLVIEGSKLLMLDKAAVMVAVKAEEIEKDIYIFDLQRFHKDRQVVTDHHLFGQMLAVGYLEGLWRALTRTLLDTTWLLLLVLIIILWLLHNENFVIYCKHVFLGLLLQLNVS